MKITFNKVKLHNFMSFEDAELALDDNGYTLISGINENPDDNAKSNGSGKSTLISESIAWALTGETVRGNKDVKRLGSEGKCEVTVEFTVDGKEFIVTRTKDPSNLFLSIGGEDKSGKGIKDTVKILAETLPDLTSSLIGSVIILGQGLPQRFTNNSPSGRKDVLEKLSKSDYMIEDLKARIQNRKNELSAKVRDIEDAALVANTKKSVSTNNLTSAKAKLAGLEATDTNKLRLDIETLSNMKATAIEERDKFQAESKEIGTRLDEAKQASYSLRTEFISKQKEVTDAFNAEQEPIKEKLASSRTTCSMLQQQINKIKNIKDVCPTCGQKLQGVEKPSTADLEAQLATAQEEASTTSELISKAAEAHQAKLKEVESQYSGIMQEASDKVSSITRELSAKEDEFRAKNLLITQLESQITGIQQQIDNFDREYEATKQIITQSESDIATFEQEILYNNGRREDIQNHLDVVNKMATVITRDFRGYLLTNVIDYINKRAKEYSKSIFGTDKIDFSLDGNNIAISYCDKPYEALSGGEAQKTNLIVQFAIRDMLCNFLDFSSNILVLDEIADNVDSVGADKLFETIATKLNDVNSIYIISHHADSNVPVDREIKIIKGADGISRVM